jgi:Rieske 2Fe-2S family protein
MNEFTQTPRSARGAYGIAGEYVTSEAIYQKESASIFSRQWLCVGRLEELDPQSGCLPISIENQNLFIIRDELGTVRAFRNFCRHRGSQLVTDANCSAMGKRIQCPYHAWTYSRSGDLTSAPNMTDADDFDEKSHGLLEVTCEVFGGFIWINFNPEQPVSQWLQPVAQQFQDWQISDLRITNELAYHVKANWKLIFQNYSECYHCPIVHPMLNRLTPYQGSSNELDEGPILGGPMGLAKSSQTMSCDGKFAGQPIENLNSDQLRSVYYFTIFPTMFLSLHPDYVLIHRIERIDKGNSKVICQFLFPPNTSKQQEFTPDQAFEFWDLTNRQDWEVCELAQKGMSDPTYLPGPYSPLESVVAAFDRNYLLELNPESSGNSTSSA